MKRKRFASYSDNSMTSSPMFRTEGAGADLEDGIAEELLTDSKMRDLVEVAVDMSARGNKVAWDDLAADLQAIYDKHGANKFWAGRADWDWVAQQTYRELASQMKQKEPAVASTRLGGSEDVSLLKSSVSKFFNSKDVDERILALRDITDSAGALLKDLSAKKTGSRRQAKRLWWQDASDEEVFNALAKIIGEAPVDELLNAPGFYEAANQYTGGFMTYDELAREIGEMSGSEILAIPGAYEALVEQYLTQVFNSLVPL